MQKVINFDFIFILSSLEQIDRTEEKKEGIAFALHNQ